MNVSVIICTYNRLEYVIQNIRLLNKECRDFIHHVYVVDNASNLPKSLNNNFVTIIPNKNLGGSGGYARGMYEAQKDKKCTHILLMDDDIKFKVSSLKKAVNKTNEIGQNDWFALGMKTFENNDSLYENTAYWSGIIRKSNFRNYSTGSSKKSCKKIKYNYAAWWSLIMPISVIKKYGYPLPYFIKSDDIEYGMRRNEDKICFDNDIFVYHENFNKKYSHSMNYYCMRNHMITNILHFKHSLIKSSLMFILRMAKAWLTFSFSKLELSMMGLKDFFLGPNFLKEIDLENNNKRISRISSETRFNLFKFVIYPFITLFCVFKFVAKHHKLKIDYLSNFKYLTSEEYWLKQFQIK